MIGAPEGIRIPRLCLRRSARVLANCQPPQYGLQPLPSPFDLFEIDSARFADIRTVISECDQTTVLMIRGSNLFWGKNHPSQTDRNSLRRVRQLRAESFKSNSPHNIFEFS
jgi:hypothetical protein